MDREAASLESTRRTIGDIAHVDFHRHDAGLRVVGALEPLGGECTERVVIEAKEAIVGRDPACDIVLTENGVSRQHARIYRTETEFVIEDLDSSNGTHVDGVPVVSCVLRSGDSIQFGQNLFLFQLLFERIEE